MKITHIFLFYSLFAINLLDAMQPIKDGKQEVEQPLPSIDKETSPISAELLNHFKKEIDKVKNDPANFYSYLKIKLVNTYPEYSDEIISLIYVYVTERNEYKVCPELHDDSVTQLHIAVYLNAVEWVKKSLKNYYANFDEDWSKRNAEHYSPLIDQKNKQGYTALALAIIQKNFDMVKILLPYSNIMNAGSMQDFTEVMKLKTEEALTILEAFFNTSREIAELIYNHVERAKINQLPPEIMAQIVDNLLDDGANDLKTHLRNGLSSITARLPSSAQTNSDIVNAIDSIDKMINNVTNTQYVQPLLDWSNYKISRSDNNESDLVNVIADEDLIIDRIYVRMKKSDPKITKLHVAIYLKNILWIKKNINNINSDDILTADAKSMVPLNLAIDKGNKTLFDILVEKLKKEPSNLSLAPVLVLALNKPNRITKSLINSNLISASDILAKDSGTNENALILTVRKSVQAQNTTTYLRLFRSLMQILNNQLSSPDLQELLQLSLHVDAPRAVEYLLDNNMITSQHILAKNLEGLDCLMMAIEKDRLILFKHFLRLCNNFNVNFDNALLYACAWNASNVVEFLLKNNYIKDVDIQDSEGDTPLIIAAKNLSDIRKYSDRSERTKYIIKLLTDFGANTYKMNKKDESAVSIASDYAPDLLPKHNTVDQNTTAIDIMLKYIGWRK